MKGLTLEKIKNACGGEFYGNEKMLGCEVSSIVTDSRKVIKDSLFAAVCGQRVDGHDFMDKCFESGALCALCEKLPEKECFEGTEKSYILVSSTLEALKKIAEYYRGMFDIPVIAVTGSVGKTSTKEMIYSVLSQRFDVHKTQGNFNNELGVPLTLFELREHHQAAVIETGISDFGEMTRLAKMVRPTACVITNIGTCHLENLKDRDGVFKAKTEIFDYVDKNGAVFLCGDDDKLNRVKDVHGIKPVFFGLADNNDFRAVNAETLGIEGMKCTLCFDGKSYDVKIPAIGTHNAINAAAAAAVGKYLKMDDGDIIRGIESFKNVGSRSNIIKTGKITVIDDCYNANPMSVKAALDALSGVSTRKTAILGDMKELGENECALHSEIGRYASDKNIDLVIAVGPLAKNISQSCEKSVWFETVEQFLESVCDYIKDGDTVLVKASHSMCFDKITEKLKSL